MRKSIFSLMALLVWMACGPASPAASARPAVDITQPPPPAGVTIYPGTASTQVRMLAETVEINVADNAPGEPPTARIRAVYTMRNMGSEAETVQVRFPLNFISPDYMTDWEQCAFPLAYPEIADFYALVDGQAAAVSNTTQTISDPAGKKGDVEVACWANFTVAFPPGQDVQIETRHTAQGAPGAYGTDVYIQFHYVLASGAAWFDTIGSAQIILRAPYTFNNKTKLPHFPENGVVNGSEIRWNYSEFEPDFSIHAAMMNPRHWQYIQDSTRAVTDAPQDGNAWWGLAEAYKAAVKVSPEGWRTDEAGYEMFGKSATAYARAAALRPDDADLRYGYAELLIWNAFYPSFGRAEDIDAGLVRGVEQLKRALEINPQHISGNALLKRLAEWPGAPRPIVNLSETGADYLILTPGGQAYTPAPTQTRTPFPPSLTPSPTWTRAPSRTPTQTAAATQAPSFVFTIDVQETAPADGNGRSPGLCGAALAPGVLAMVMVVMRKRPRG